VRELRFRDKKTQFLEVFKFPLFDMCLQNPNRSEKSAPLSFIGSERTNNGTKDYGNNEMSHIESFKFDIELYNRKKLTLETIDPLRLFRFQ
jgi:hypothetical protein